MGKAKSRPYREVRAKLAARAAQREPVNLPAPVVPAVLPPPAPTVGRIVWISRTVGAPLPAIVTNVHAQLADEEAEGTPPTVSVVVFDAMNGESTLPAESLRWVRYGAQPGQWSWPPRAAR